MKFISTCRTDGCGNKDIEVEIEHVDSNFVSVCGVCGQEIKDVKKINTR